MNPLAAILPRYGLAGAEPRLLSRSENEIWAAGDLVFRIARAGYHSRAELLSELAWLAALQGTPGLLTLRPVPAQDGALLIETGGRLVAAFTRIEGSHPEPGPALSPHFRQIGRIAARLHRHAEGWTRPHGFTRKSWTIESMIGPNAIWGDWRSTTGLTAQDRDLIGRASAEIARRIGAWDGAFGLIHGDLRLGNLLLTPTGEIAVLDFDDCGFGWQMFDFAASVSFIETAAPLGDLASAWLDGYAEIAPLRASDAAMLPTMVMMRRIQLTAWLTSRAGSDTWAEYGG
ncbi:MAG: phosphotransferase, partial [Paracoccus sp. (in: a-proteobacteria)]|nr:phosphotransferase [Paracoccus sp. (in: a-proteobacteria)]